MSGLFGVVSRQDCLNDLFYGTDYHSHLGSAKAGLAAYYGDKFIRAIHSVARSQFKAKFASELNQMQGKLGIGVISDYYSQPILVSSRFHHFALVMTGRLNNKKGLIKKVKKNGGSFSEVNRGRINSVEVAGKVIAGQKSLTAGIKEFFSQLDGSASLLILTSKGILAVRDKMGRSCLVIGKKNSSRAVASESSSLPNLGFEKEKELAPGEIILISKKGIKQLEPGSQEKRVCAFRWIYTAFPASSFEGVTVEKARERSGAALARRDKKAGLEVDLVAGIPDSGTAHAIGYAQEAAAPYRRILLKYTAAYGRSYIPAQQSRRDEIAAKKLIPVPQLIKDKRVVICDDSIVRGTQLRNQVVERLWHYGAAEVHARIACPPLLFPCPYFLSTRTKEELAARRAIGKTAIKGANIDQFYSYDNSQYQKMVEEIAQKLNVTSLKYQHWEDMQQAIGLPAEQLCFYCWRGEE